MPANVREDSELGGYRGRTLVLLDLMGNPATRTTKTFASLVIVARAVRHIRATGEPITIITPSSANKATALRDAVYRALAAGLVGPEQLNIIVVVPPSATPKLWASPLTDDPDLRALNPIVVHQGAERAAVKDSVYAFPIRVNSRAFPAHPSSSSAPRRRGLFHSAKKL